MAKKEPTKKYQYLSKWTGEWTDFINQPTTGELIALTKYKYQTRIVNETVLKNATRN